ncbi:MAG TPA: FAD:protein FMN transferase [Alphaproteobacteria bacterium]|nr:FAD:protein FMN transferase [Alphaproteobacteria bacterium]
MIISKKFEAIGSIIEVKIDSDSNDKRDYSSAFELLSQELIRFEAEYSRFKETSKLSQLNNSLGEWVSVSEEFIFIVKKALEYNKSTLGYFDITVKSTLDKIGYDKDYSFAEKTEKETPKNNMLHKLKANIQDKIQSPILIDEKNSKILIRKQIDFGGIGKGYEIDKLAEILESNNIEKYYINAGGDIKVKGEWTLLLEHPDNLKMVIGKIPLKDGALAASAPNRRKWGKDGKLHHLINPKTKKPADDMKAVFAMAKTGIDSDVYATSLFTAGFLEAIKLAKKLKIEVLLISTDNKYYVSEGFNAELFGQ